MLVYQRVHHSNVGKAIDCIRNLPWWKPWNIWLDYYCSTTSLMSHATPADFVWDQSIVLKIQFRPEKGAERAIGSLIQRWSLKKSAQLSWVLSVHLTTWLLLFNFMRPREDGVWKLGPEGCYSDWRCDASCKVFWTWHQWSVDHRSSHQIGLPAIADHDQGRGVFPLTPHTGFF